MQDQQIASATTCDMTNEMLSAGLQGKDAEMYKKQIEQVMELNENI